MKKKVVYFLFSLFLVFGVTSKVYAVGSEAAQEISIKSSGEKVDVGTAVVNYWTYKDYVTYSTTTKSGSSDYKYGTYSAAYSACKSSYACTSSTKCSCTIRSKSVYYCDGYHDTKSSCLAVKTYGSCKFVNKLIGSDYYTCSLFSSSKYYIKNGSAYSRCLTYCKKSKCPCSSTLNRFAYYASGSTTTAHDNRLEYQTTGPKSVYSYKYVNTSSSSGGDPTYCIQPGNTGPNGATYCLNENVNLNACKSVNDYYFCGLGYILSFSAKEVTGSDGKKTYVYKTSSDSDYYDYHAIAIALRLWTAYWNKYKGSNDNILADADGFGYESPESFQYISNTSVYGNTATAIKENGYTQSNRSPGFGIIYGSSSKIYVKAIELFNKAYKEDGSNEFFESLSSDEDYSKPTVSATKITEENGKIEVVLPEEFSKIQVACTKEELLGKSANSACKVRVKIKDEKGKVIDDSRIVSGFCDKEHCTIEVSGEKTCEKYVNKRQVIKWTYTVTLLDWGSKAGYVRQYINCNGANNTQVMMTYAINQVKDEEASGSYNPNTSASGYIYVKCPCDSSKYCDMEKQQGIENLPSECEGNEVLNSGEYDGYVKATKEDPYMNCILNACYPEDKDEYDYSTEYGVNTNVCRIYCRQDVNFYMANKTRVYAGMQFSYNIGTKLIEDNVIKTQVADGRKLTSVVLQERQCTTEIYYDKKAADGLTWLDRYDTATKNMIDKWNEWKKWETLKLAGYGTKVHYADVSTSCTSRSCGCNASYADGYATTWWYWPPSYVNGKEGSYKTNGATTHKNALFDTYGGSDTTSLTSGTEPTSDSCGGSGRYAHGGSKCGSKDSKGNCIDTTWSCGGGGCSVTSGSKGSDGNESELLAKIAAAKNEYEAARKVVSQLLYDLQNCNSYTSAEINDPYGVASPAINGGTSKDYILKKTACEKAEDCIDLEVGYDDKNYGKSVLFDKEIKVTDSELNQTYYCKEGEQSNPDCYDYIENTENEINAKAYSKKYTQTKEYIYCSGEGANTSCVDNTISLPTSDYATFITVTEADFWQPQKFQTESFTGKVTKVDDAMAENENTTSLGESVFPVSKNKESGSTGSYGVDYKFTKITSNGNNKLSTYDFSCSYDIYNIMNLYDCEISYDADGQVDISGCSNNCYEVIDNVPIIKDGCTAWSTDNTTSKGYGFIYRNVDLSNLFPTTRPVGDNWSKEDTKITEIQESSDDVFINDEYLEYSFVLTPNAIRKIRNYNSENSSKGSSGYLNNTLESCEKIPVSEGSTLYSFYNCKSSFITSIKDENSGFEVKTIKGDGISIHNSKTIGGGK